MMSREEKNKEIQDELIWQERKEKYSKIIFQIIKIILVLLLIIFIFFLIIRYVGTSGLVVKEYAIYNNKVPSSFDGIKIIHFSDLHYGNVISKNETQKLVNKINKIKPDIIFFTGDLLDEEYFNKEDKEFLISALNDLEANIGKYSIKGESDKTIYTEIIGNTDFIELTDTYQLVYSNSTTPILISGIDNEKENNEKSFAYFNEEEKIDEIFHIVLSHEPDIIDEITTKYSPDLMLSGHSHNGQITLPYFGGLYKKEGATKYYEPYYQVGNTEIFISSGLGSSPYPYRLFNHPSINFYRLRKE